MKLFHNLLFALARFARTVDASRTITQTIAGSIALGLGFWGWHIHKPPIDFAGWFNNVFRTIQLLTLQFPINLESGIPWQLQIARLAVPLVAAVATFHLLVGAITRPVRLALMPHARGHIIICGAGQLTARALETLAARGRQVVILGENIEASRRAALEGLAMTVLDADPREPATLKGLNIKRAAAVFLLAGNDLDNLDLAMVVLAETRHRPANEPPLALALLIDNDDLAREIDATLDTRARAAHVRYHRICPDREGLRLDLQLHAPVFLKPDRTVRSHVLVIGLQGDWRQALMQLVIAAQDHPEVAPLFSLVLDDNERGAFDSWLRVHPDLRLIAEFKTLERGTGILPSEDAMRAWRTDCPAPQLAVTLRNDADAVATILALRRPANAFGLTNQPILAHRSSEDRLLAAIQGDGPPVKPFGGLIRAETIERTLDRRGDDLAIALHAHYLDAAATLGAGSPQALQAWDALPENLRDANRAAADHAGILFAAIDFELGEEPIGEKLEALARTEHRRWMADRIDRGWRSGPARDDDKRIHPGIKPFDELSGADQEKDRNAVRVIAKLYSRLTT